MIEYFLERLEDRVLLSSAAASVPKTVADLYSTREGAVLRVNAEAGVLANDTSSGASLRVTDFDLTSKFGARVQMANDGRFTYDPRSAKALTSLPLGKAAEDTFKYTVNGRIVGHVTVTVLGAADAPEDTARP